MGYNRSRDWPDMVGPAIGAPPGVQTAYCPGPVHRDTA